MCTTATVWLHGKAHGTYKCVCAFSRAACVRVYLRVGVWARGRVHVSMLVCKRHTCSVRAFEPGLHAVCVRVHMLRARVERVRQYVTACVHGRLQDGLSAVTLA